MRLCFCLSISHTHMFTHTTHMHWVLMSLFVGSYHTFLLICSLFQQLVAWRYQAMLPSDRYSFCFSWLPWWEEEGGAWTKQVQTVSETAHCLLWTHRDGEYIYNGIFVYLWTCFTCLSKSRFKRSSLKKHLNKIPGWYKRTHKISKYG